MRNNLPRLASAAAACAAFVVLGAGPAAAHEDRQVLGGRYELGVGWGDEPTYVGFKNSVTLEIADRDGKPVIDQKDLEVQVESGEETVDLALEPAFGEPGLYEATLVPTKAGTYSFTFTGTINGQAFDETFTSSDTTFDSPKEPSEVQFPAKQPSPAQLAERLDRETARVQTAAADAEDKASSASTLGIAGIVVGALGLVVGGVGLTRKR